MSGAMEMAEEFWSYGLSRVPDKNLCASHVDDKAIKRFIIKNSEYGYCDYCGKDRKVAALDEVMIFIMETLSYFYSDANDFSPYDSSEGGFLVETFDGWEIIQDEFQLDITNTELFEDMQNSIDYGRAWADENKYYDEGPDMRLISWKYFSYLVKHRVRYLFPAFKEVSDRPRILPAKMLPEIGKLIKKYKLTTTLEAGEKFYRCRQHNRKEKISLAHQMCAPDIKFTNNPNRMSPAGISMFYAASEIETSLEETLDTTWKGSSYTFVQFALKDRINVIDLSKIPALPSPFDQEKRKQYFELSFLKDFVRDLTKPISRDGMAHIEYVPTQIVTEYFRHSFGLRVDGIIYPSSKNKGKNAVVLFYDHYESQDNLTFLSRSLSTLPITKFKSIIKAFW